MAASTSMKFRVAGMDCAACATKIENAMQRLPGVADISVSYGQGRLALSVDEDRTSRATIENKIRALGYTPTVLDAEAGVADLANIADGPWWRSVRGRLVIATTVLLSLAYLVSHIEPSWATGAYVLATVLGLIPIGRRALTGAMSGTPFSIEMLMSIAAIGAIAIDEAPEAAIVVFLFTVGELLEGVAAGRARAGIRALMDLVPRTAQRLRGTEIEIVPVEFLAIGDVVVVRPGDRIPSDGEVLEGTSEIDEAPVTGESVPVAKGAGQSVYAGSISLDGELRVRISRTTAGNTIARIIHTVEEAQASKAPVARAIDSFSRWYTPVAMIISLLVIVVPPLLFDGDWDTWIYRGLAVLLIACPCALVVSTPAAVASGLASGARIGLLIKSGAALEALGKVKTIAFDKTGTLTLGKPKVADVVVLQGSEEHLLAKASAVERGANHPLGQAILAEATRRALDIPRAFGGSTITPGKAVTARVMSGFVSVGSPRYAEEQAILDANLKRKISALEEAGKTVVVVLEARRLLGLIALRDEPRPDAREGLEEIRALGIKTVMLTGDNARTGEAIGRALDIDVRAELLPEDKLQAISAYRALAHIAMVGDGINDAPALAAASVGIAMGGGTDVALETADVAILKDRVTGVAELVRLSRTTLANIRQNIALALGLKCAFLVTTLLGTTPLWMAILADTGATVLVTANALRLLRFKRAQ
ncbi:heavy metal translocating P-type ATPase [Reyranella sp.]|jgi:Cd2+/Zn2+-exporting ATPase|uniref:heavy metal translocating P-type ATPase n=1 Tax=Reyranella sp. TaxID=1929291 RepID=UPI003F71D374